MKLFAFGRVDDFARRLATPRGVALLFAIYGLTYSLLRAASGGALLADEIHENILVQSLEWGYAFRNPPLYEWMLWAVQQITGPRVIGFLFVKYGLFTLTGVLYFLLARRILGDARWALLATLSILLLFYVGWDYHRMFSHTAVLMTAIPFAFLALLRVAEYRRPADYAVAGLALGVGILSKYLFVVFAVAMIAAFASKRESRKALASPWAAVTIAITIAIIAPHALWLSSAIGEFAEVSSGYLARKESYLSRLAEGAGGFLISPLAFLAPFILVAGVAFPRALKPLNGSLNFQAMLLERTLIFGFALLAAGIVFGAVDNVQKRYMFVFLFLAPIYFFARAREAGSAPGRARLYAVALGAIAAMTFAMKAADSLAGPPFCKSCNHLAPYEPAVAALREMGADETSTIIGAEFYTAGNVKRYFPKARVTSPLLTKHAPYVPPRSDGGECFFVWRLDLLGGAGPADAVAMIDAGDYIEESKIVEAPWRGLGAALGFGRRSDARERSAPETKGAVGPRVARWGIARLDPAAPACNAFTGEP